MCGLLAVSALGAFSRAASAEALLLIQADDGKVLRAENATYPWYPASVTKLMTTYVTLQAIKAKRISLDTLFTVSANAVAQQPSKMGFPLGTQVTVDNALKMMMVKSANDMAVVLAEGVSGSIDKFADEMNATARRLGMTQTNYVNPNGLPDDRQITSARDLAILSRALMHDFPEYDLYWHIPAIKFGKRIFRNINPLIDRFPGADGMKTGFICAAGFNLVASATRDGKRLIAVVLGAPSAAARAIKAAQLLEQGFESSPLSWLTPSLGTVENLQPIDATPPDLHDQVCGKHRKKPASEDEDVAGKSDSDSPQAFMLSSLRGGKQFSLSDPLIPSMPPIVVHTGPARPADTQTASIPDVRAKKTAQPGQIAPASGSAAFNGLLPWPGSANAAAATSDPVPVPRPRPRIARSKPAKQ
ncbi:MAG TPA: D-alanyl-D-alanine carboxypeptidase family protein [Xanthobacteraceae bacterium]|nr:D-alanyl-D-alanine carboxypeptidase family protein [Xanthobacteraceae bacterium]